MKRMKRWKVRKFLKLRKLLEKINSKHTFKNNYSFFTRNDLSFSLIGLRAIWTYDDENCTKISILIILELLGFSINFKIPFKKIKSIK